jgi:hypothetical protein
MNQVQSFALHSKLFHLKRNPSIVIPVAGFVVGCIVVPKVDQLSWSKDDTANTPTKVHQVPSHARVIVCFMHWKSVPNSLDID